MVHRRRATAVTRPATASRPAAPATKTTTRKMVKAVGKPHIPHRYPKPASASAPAATTAVQSAGSTRYEGRREEVMAQSIVKSQGLHRRPRMDFDPHVGDIFLTYARMLVSRGYVHNTLGNMAIRRPHPGYEHGVVYTKHSGVSLEEATADNIVITDIPTPRLLHGTVPTSVGHQLNREILRLRTDINAVIHVHHDETIA